MRILSVSLKNFKTHEDRFFEFSMGTNAISGENGAGKTSILEAIAWVIFDYTPYVTDEMIREGASNAEVTVSFVSAKEDRTYDVSRSTTTGYRLYDPQLDRRLEYEKKADVLPWLREHVGVPPGTDMAKLFSHTIGVPQGTFTADFLKRSQERKKVFDSILKVEEYQAVYRELLGLQRYGEARVAEIAHQIELCETQLKDWDDLSIRHQNLTAAIAADTATLAQLETQLQTTENEIATLDAMATQLSDTEQQWQEIEQKIALSTQTVEQKQKSVEEAEAARDRLSSCQVGYDAFTNAETVLQQLEVRRHDRQTLQTQREALLDRDRDRQTQLARLQERLDVLDRAERDIETLQPQLARQIELERDQKNKTAIAAELQELHNERTLMRVRLDEQHGRLQQLEHSANEAKSAATLCEASVAGYEAFLAASDRIGHLEQSQMQRQELLEQRSALTDELQTYQGDRARLAQQLQRAQHIERDVQSLERAVLEQERLEAQQVKFQQDYQTCQIARVQLQQHQHDRQTHLEAIASLQTKLDRRPKLQERIDLIPAIEGHIARIDSQIARVSAAQQFRQELNAIQASGRQDLDRYRSQLNTFWPMLKPLQQTYPELQSFHATLKEGIGVSESLLAQIETILADLSEQVAVPQLEERQTSLRSQLQSALQARVQLQELDDVAAEAEKRQAQVKSLDETLEDLQWQLEAEPTHARNLQDIQTSIEQLGNPRSRSKLLQEELATYTSVEREWNALEAKLNEHHQHLQTLDRDLAATADIASQLSTLQNQRQVHAEAYQRYLQSETLAATWSDRHQAYELALDHLATSKTQVAEWDSKIATLEENHGTLKAIQSVQEDLAAQLQDLRDPRQQLARLADDLKTRPSIERERNDCATQQQSDRQALEILDRDLAEFVDLDRDMTRQSALKEEHRDTYQLFLVSQPLADRLPERQDEFQTAQKQLAEEQKGRAELDAQRKTIAGQYDRGHHDELKQLLSVKQQERAALSAKLDTVRPQLDEINLKRKDLESIRDRLKDIQREKKQRDRVQRFIKYSRSVYKDAGPRITELYQRSVNHEADRLFREILNRPNVSLQWESDYDIAIREGGSKKRRFISLSGGEQMTAALAVRLALLKVLADIDVAFFDEPTTNMDRPRRERLAEAIANIKSFQQLFVISHDDTFETITENVIRVERQN